MRLKLEKSVQSLSLCSIYLLSSLGCDEHVHERLGKAGGGLRSAGGDDPASTGGHQLPGRLIFPTQLELSSYQFNSMTESAVFLSLSNYAVFMFFCIMPQKF